MKKKFSFIQPGDEFGKCSRCGIKFIPRWVEILGCFDRCCTTCQIRNLADAGFPELLEMAGLQPEQ